MQDHVLLHSSNLIQNPLHIKSTFNVTRIYFHIQIPYQKHKISLKIVYKLLFCSIFNTFLLKIFVKNVFKEFL